MKRFLELAADEDSPDDAVRSQLAAIEGRADEILSRQIVGNVDKLYSHKNNELLLSVITRHSNATRNVARMLGPTWYTP